MKKSKKLSLQSLALVLMSFILVAGVAFGMTGAWFAEAKDATPGQITMGKEVTINVTGVTLNANAKDPDKAFDATAAMPGDKFDLAAAAVANADTSDMYIRAQVTIELGQTGEGADLTLADLGLGTIQPKNWFYNEGDGFYYYATDMDTLTTVVAQNDSDSDTAAINLTCTVNTALTNTVALESAEINITFQAIQKANYAYVNWAAAFPPVVNGD